MPISIHPLLAERDLICRNVPIARTGFQSTRSSRSGTRRAADHPHGLAISIHPLLAERDPRKALTVAKPKPFQSTRSSRSGTALCPTAYCA